MDKINFIVIDDHNKLKTLLRELIHEEKESYVLQADQAEDEIVMGDAKRQATQLIRDLGIPANIKGYIYLRDAIILAIMQPDSINAITKVMYPEVARQNMTTSTRVERAIRHAIEVAWARGNNEFMEEVFGYTVDISKGKPTNSECIALLADKIRMDQIDCRVS